MIRSKFARFAIVGVMAAAIPAFAVVSHHHKLTAKTTAVASVKPAVKKVTTKKVAAHKLVAKKHVAHKLVAHKATAKKLTASKKTATALTAKKTVKSM